MTTKAEIDWMGRWYTIAKARGVNTIAMIAFVYPKKKEIEWNAFCHETMDGVGGMVKWLRKKGYKIDEMPKARPAAKMNFFKKIKIFINGMKNLESRKIAWKQINAQAENPNYKLISYALFTADETKQIDRFVRSKGMSQNSYFLSLMHNFIFPQLAEKGAVGGWIFPVNMRGNLSRKDPYCNQSSGVSIDLGFHSKPSDVHQKIKEQLSQNVHWANWWTYQIGRLIGVKGMRYLSERSSDKSHFIGTFTNMGAWPPNAETYDATEHEDEYFIAAPPGTRNYPISIAVGSWFGKLGITLKIHPYILSEQGKVDQMLEEIKGMILRESSI